MSKFDTCKGCIADLGSCKLGFKTEVVSDDYRFNGQNRPLEECPKPTTQKAYHKEIRRQANKEMGSKYA